ncbi:sigma-70 family RNA polymerase sigma factor [Flaviaesturariibacter terrae]
MRQLVINPSLTQRQGDSLDRYLADINRMPMVDINEEQRLAQEIRAGSDEALQQLVCANLRFVVSVAKQYQFRGLSLADLINEGNLGLVRSASRFDETRGFKFITYAVWWIRQGIVQALDEKGRLVRLPANQLGLGIRAQRASDRIEQDEQRLPTLAEVAEALDIDPKQLAVASRIGDRHESLDAERPGMEGFTMGDSLFGDDESDQQLVHTQSLHIELERFLATLKTRDRSVLCALFGVGGVPAITMGELAERMDMTRERIRQIRDRALKTLRDRSRSERLRDFL